ncbi:spastin [Colletotrichum abscissum]|uniref:Spastin n=2 Tax=Colletotrichum abscissum TaxID=1671311 RepID=A0A9P9XBX0_9PEZI|nr:spastin [Colletotrichum abscissum]
MLSISTSEVWQKCHGEDEKMIKAIFSLARKLYPCIVFIDEADAMLGTRKAGEKRHIRSMLNQFLMEWDGLTTDTKAPFVLLATNRPFDLDPAVLRRAPVQIHLKVPTQNERAGILGLLLEGETLQQINPNLIARLTPNYTGSDLKNLCVMAATNCVNSQPRDTTERVLTRAHFSSALQTISATNIGRLSANEFKKFEGRLEENVEGSPREEDED